MDEHDWLAERVEANRTHLRAVAYRMLGSLSEADDAVQESWLRLSRSGTSGVENLGGWLTTIVARVCLDMLRSRTSRREEPLGAHLPDRIGSHADGIDPEHEVLLADAVGPALLVILETLAPAERLAFVLHDMFAVPFDEIAPTVGRSPTAARQLANRTRRRLQGADTVQDADLARQREVVDAYLAASRNGDFGPLLAVLDPDVVLRADHAAVQAGASEEVRGALGVAETFSGRARFAQPALVNGAVGADWAPGGRPRVVFGFTIAREKIVEIQILAATPPASASSTWRSSMTDALSYVAARVSFGCSRPIGSARPAAPDAAVGRERSDERDGGFRRAEDSRRRAHSHHAQKSSIRQQSARSVANVLAAYSKAL